MRFRVVFAIATFAFVIAPVARAATLPDLPGMGPAQKAVSGHDVTTTSSAPSRPSLPAAAKPATTTSSAQTSISPDAVNTIKSLPGEGAVPVISTLKTSAHSPIAGQDTLVMIAALGSFAGLGALYMLRRLGRI